MLAQLKKIFPSLTDDLDIEDASMYEWYITSSNQILGIHEGDLTDTYRQLLDAFLTPYNRKLPTPSKAERAWKNLIKTNQVDDHIHTGSTFRFVYFIIQQQLEPKAFLEAITALFLKPVPILWQNEQEGFIVEEMDETLEDDISYDEIIDTFMSDLSVQIKFFVGPFQKTYTDVDTYYNICIHGMKAGFKHSAKRVITHIDAIPFLFIDGMKNHERDNLIRMVLQDSLDDDELLDTMEIFMECNLNISETAKVLYLHRNSLQYRLDKFREKTGIDMRIFHHALSFYLLTKARP